MTMFSTFFSISIVGFEQVNVCWVNAFLTLATKALVDDDDELFLWYGWPTKDVKPYLQPGPLSEILTIANLRHAASRVWTSAEPKFRLSWIKLCSSDNHYTTAPQIMILLLMLDDSAFNFTKSHTPPWLFFTFFKLCKNGTKSRKASHI